MALLSTIPNVNSLSATWIFIGHHISADGITPLPSKVEAITHFPAPTNSKSLPEWLGMVNFYHRFIPHAVALMKPLHEAAHSKPFIWSADLQSAFEATKKGLATAALILHPSYTVSTRITVDASDTAVGCTLEQLLDGEWRPIAFFSKKLDPAQAKYCAFDRELLAMYLAIQHFPCFIEGCPFTLFTDHKALTYAFSKAFGKYSPRQQRHLAYVSEFATDIQHIKGKDNVTAHTLSRIILDDQSQQSLTIILGTICTTVIQIDYCELAHPQSTDTEVHATQIAQPPQNLFYRTYQCQIPHTHSCVMSLLHNLALLFLRHEEKKNFDLIHGLSHPGIKTSWKLMTSRLV